MTTANMPAKKKLKSGKPSSGGKKKGKKSAKSGKSAKTAKSGKSSAISRVSPAKEDTEVDMLNPHAMENLYYIAHAAADALELRGFGWSEAPKGKKGKKGKKK